VKRMGGLAGFRKGLAALLSVSGVLFGCAAVLHAMDLKGVSFPNQLAVGGETCRLAGVGVHKKFFMDIYYAGLYMKTPVRDPEAVIQSGEPKAVVLHVVYKQVDPDKWVDGWREGFSKKVPDASPELKKKMERFTAFFDQPVKKGEEIRIAYEPGVGTTVVIAGTEKGTVSGDDFMKALWRICLGRHAASADLTKGMGGL